MHFFLVGLNHRTAPLEVREKFWLSVEEIQKALTWLQEKYFSESLILSTCNRTEIYGVIGDSDYDPGAIQATADSIISELCRMKCVNNPSSENCFYTFQSCSALRHLFKVACGIDSMVVGDIQILGQVKTSFRIAESKQALGTLLKRLKQSTLHVAKRARTESDITEGAVSISYAAVELAGKIFSKIGAKTALLIGAGETAELAAKHLTKRGVHKLFIANRTRSKAEELAADIGGTVVELPIPKERLSASDIVISSVTIDQYVLSSKDIQSAMRARGNRPIIVLDLGVPRNIDPSAKALDNVFLYDIDALDGVVAGNLQRRRSEVPKVNAIIFEELRAFNGWIRSLSTAPTITELRERFEEIRCQEVAKQIKRFKEREQEFLEQLTKRIVNRLLHDPTTTLRNNSQMKSEERLRLVQTARELFRLDQDENRGRK